MNTTESDFPCTETTPLAARIFQNTAILLAGRIAGVFLAGISSIFVVRGLGSAQFGQFSSVYAYVSLFAWLATMGLEPVLAREAARSREQSASIIATGVVLAGVFAAVSTALVVFFASFAGYQGELRLLIAFAAAELLLFAPLRLAAVIFQVDLRQWYGTAITFFRQLLWLSMVVVLAIAKASLVSFVVARLASAAVETGLLLYGSARFLKPPRQILVQNFRSYLRASLPIAFSTLLASVYFRIDQVMLHRLATDSVLGLYAAAVRVSELFEMLPAALLASLFPVLAVAVRESGRIAAYSDRIFRYIVTAAGLLCTLVYGGADLVVRGLYGTQFAGSAHLLRILIWSEFAVFFGSAVANLLLAYGLQKYLIYPTVVGAVLNILLNMSWIPRYSAEGAAWATLASYTIAWSVPLLTFARTRGIIWAGLRKAIPVALISAASALFVTWSPLPRLVGLAAGLAFYVAAIGVFGTIRMSDLQYVRGAISHTLRRN